MSIPDLHATQVLVVGDPIGVRFAILDEDDSDPYPLTGATITAWRLRRGVVGAFDPVDAVLTDASVGVTVTVEDAPGGLVRLDAPTAALEPGIYYHQLFITNANQIERMSAHGHFDLRRSAK